MLASRFGAGDDDEAHYLYQGECRAMTTFDAGVLKGSPGKPDTPVVFRATVHGPVLGYATVGGVKVALSQRRSTRGREGINLIPFMELNENVPTSPQSWIKTLSKLELAFYWHYADSKHIAFFSNAAASQDLRAVRVLPRSPPS